MRHARREADVIEDLRPVRIETLLAFDGEWLTFAAADSTGPLLVRVYLLSWERLRARAPDFSDSEDQRDHAIGMIELHVAAKSATMTAQGRLITLNQHDA